MKIIKTTISISIFSLILLAKAVGYENKILFKVNNEIVTSIDILNEIEHLKLINKNFEKLEQKQVFEITKNSLIREKIKIIELSNYFDSFEIDQEYYELLLDNYKKKLNLRTTEEFKNYIKNKGVKYETIINKIQIEILWNQLIIQKYSKDIKIDKSKIKKNLSKNNFQKEFLISEILFNLDNGEKLTDKFDSIKNQIKTKSFEEAALMYSISASANNGGKLGWIKLNSLNLKVKNEILKTNIGDFTKPIVIPGGFLILKIEEERKTKILENLDKEVENIAKEIANKQLNQFSNIYINKLKKEININEFR